MKLKENIGKACEDINYKFFLGLDDFIARYFEIHLLEQWEINQNQENAPASISKIRCPSDQIRSVTQSCPTL